MSEPLAAAPKKAVRLAVALAFALLANVVGGPPEAAPALPDSVRGWIASGGEEVFVGDELFLYIDGGAEVYREYGFQRVAVREYRREEEEITVEVYTMTGDAYGIFSLMKSESSEAVDLGDGGSLSKYYARFWAGPHLVVVTARDGPGDARDSVLDLARGLAAGFPRVRRRPSLVGRLPVANRVPGSERYVVGAIGMRRIAPDVFRFFGGVPAAAARYSEPDRWEGSLHVLLFPDAAAASGALDRARERGGGAPGVGFALTLEDGKALVAERKGKLLFVAESAAGPPAARGLLRMALDEVSHERARE